ncbi:N-acetyltransferase [Actinomadura cremea]|nr:N-acetyltransferase [Actinomadura cremea]
MSTEVTDNTSEQRYDITVDGAPAGYAEYEPGEGVVMFTHTEVDPAFKGQGVGGALARGALDDVRAKGLGVVPLCPFIKGWIGKHPDYQDLVAR